MWHYIRKATAQLELRLARAVRGNESFYSYVSNERVKERKIELWLKNVGSLVMGDAEKAEVLCSAPQSLLIRFSKPLLRLE